MGLTPTEIYAINGVMAHVVAFITIAAWIQDRNSEEFVKNFNRFTSVQYMILMTLLLGRLVL